MNKILLSMYIIGIIPIIILLIIYCIPIMIYGKIYGKDKLLKLLKQLNDILKKNK